MAGQLCRAARVGFTGHDQSCSIPYVCLLSHRCTKPSPLTHGPSSPDLRPQDFMNDPPTTIFLLNAQVAAVGLTLVAASHMFLVGPAGAFILKKSPCLPIHTDVDRCLGHARVSPTATVADHAYLPPNPHRWSQTSPRWSGRPSAGCTAWARTSPCA